MPRTKRPAAADNSEDLAEWLALKDRALAVAAEGVTIADARLPDRPLIYANEGFERMTGYGIAEVMGRNCRFLQGPGTDQSAMAELRAALDAGRECLVEVLNYRKNGTTFWNRLSITPIRDSSGEVTHFIGIQSDVTARRLAEEGLRKSKESLEHDLRLAARVQQSLLPPPETETGGFRIAHVFLPCDDLAGDGVGIDPLPDGRVGLYVLDVSGHGVGAALLSFTLAHLLSTSAEGSVLTERTGAGAAVVAPSRVADRLNRQFPMDRTRQYFTLLYGVITPSSGRFEYVTAGHPAPILLRRGDSPQVVGGTGFPIGMLEDAIFEDAAVTLEPGDRLYLYTDGVSEAADDQGREFGRDRLAEEVTRWRGLPLRDGLDRAAAAVRGWSGGPLRDDVSLLGVERLP